MSRFLKNTLMVIAVYFSILLSSCLTAIANDSNSDMYSSMYEAAAKIIITEYDSDKLFKTLENGIKTSGAYAITKMQNTFSNLSNRRVDMGRELIKLRTKALFKSMYKYNRLVSGYCCTIRHNSNNLLKEIYSKLYIRYLKSHYKVY